MPQITQIFADKKSTQSLFELFTRNHLNLKQNQFFCDF